MSQDLAKANGVKILVYSQAGMGKTVLCATAPKPILLSAESGLLSLSNKNLIRIFGENNPSVTYNIPTIPIKSYMDFQQAYHWVSRNLNQGYFQTVCLDSLNEIAEICLANIRVTVKHGQQAYGELLDQMLIAIKNFRDLNCHVYVTCKLDRKEDAGNGLLHQPLMPGRQLALQLPFIFDEIFYMTMGTTDKGEKYRVLQTSPDAMYEAKDRSGCLDMYELPDLTNIIRKVEEAG